MVGGERRVVRSDEVAGDGVGAWEEVTEPIEASDPAVRATEAQRKE